MLYNIVKRELLILWAKKLKYEVAMCIHNVTKLATGRA